MVVRLSPETESRLQELAATTGRAPDDLAELSQVRDMLDTRYDDIKSGRVQPIDGGEVFRRLRQNSENLRNS